MRANLSGVKAAEEGKGFTPPGTIDVFEIEDIKFDEKNGKELFEVTFATAEHSFRETFYLTEKAAERFVYLYSKVNGTEVLPEDENGIISQLKGKKVALKVIGTVSQTNGKGYPSLPYSGFARPVALISELSFSNTEKGKINAAIEAQISSAAQPNNQTAAQPAAPGQGGQSGGTDDLPF